MSEPTSGPSPAPGAPPSAHPAVPQSAGGTPGASANASAGLLRPWQSWVLLGVALLGVLSFAAGLKLSPARSWLNLLLGNFYFVSVGAVAALFLAIHAMASAGWHVVFKRVPEAMTAYLPAGAAVMLGLVFGVHSVYHWSHADAVAADPVLADKAWWLNTAFWAVRAAIYLGLWIWLTRRIVGNSRRQDATGEVGLTFANVRASAIYAVTFALTFSLAAVDWLMSLEPHWYSTIYPWYVFSSMLVGAVCWIVMLVTLLKWRGALPQVNEHHLHDLGKYVFAFSMFWGYLWLSQYLLIWYANLPEETPHYTLRSEGAWRPVFLANVVLNAALPFFALLPARCKKSLPWLFSWSLALALGHYLDLYLLILPTGFAKGPVLGWQEAGLFLGLGSVFVFLFDRSLRRAALVPERDPYLTESLHHHG